jgi:hypothetical protein
MPVIGRFRLRREGRRAVCSMRFGPFVFGESFSGRVRAPRAFQTYWLHFYAT